MSQDLKGKNVFYTAKVRTEGDRNGGVSRSDDGRISLTHTLPGAAGTGTNSEQLLAAGWAACFQGAMAFAARTMKVSIPSGSAIDAEVDLLQGEDGYSLQARFEISVPGVPRDTALALIESAHQTCPYSKALRGIPMELKLV